MDIVPQLIKSYSVVLYAVCGIACAYFVFTGLASLRELRRAVFRLERNAVMSRAVGAWLKALLCILAASAVFIISALAPVRPTNNLLTGATSTPAHIVPPTSVPTANISEAEIQAAAATPEAAPVSITVSIINTPAAEPTAAAGQPGPTATAEPSPIPPPPAAAPVDCSSADAQLTSPAAGEAIKGVYTLRGTAVVDAGGYYKLEILMPGDQWAFLGKGDMTVQNGDLLPNYNFDAIQPATYAIRLVVVNADANPKATCQIPVTITR